MNRLRIPSPALAVACLELAGAPAAREIAVGSVAGNANGVLVVTRDSAGATMVDRSFHLTVSC